MLCVDHLRKLKPLEEEKYVPAMYLSMVHLSIFLPTNLAKVIAEVLYLNPYAIHNDMLLMFYNIPKRSTKTVFASTNQRSISSFSKCFSIIQCPTCYRSSVRCSGSHCNNVLYKVFW